MRFMSTSFIIRAAGSLYAVKDYYKLNPRFRPLPPPPRAGGKGGGAASREASDDDLLRELPKRPRGTACALLWTSSSIIWRRTANWRRAIHDGLPAMRSAKSSHRSRSIPTIRKRRPLGDLAELDYSPPQQDEIAAYFEELVRHYVGLGFRGFRCDAAYKVPATCGGGWSMPRNRAIPMSCSAPKNVGASEEKVLALDEAGWIICSTA